MLIYSVLMFVVAAAFTVIGFQIFRGKTELIHAYHQTKVTDSAAYGRSFGKAMGVFAGSTFVSGVISVMGDAAAVPAVLVLLAGLAIGIVCIVAVQRKYNQGLF